MLKDVTLGQFFPGNSIFHKTDPRIKILLTIAYIVAIFLAKSAIAYAFLLLVSVLMTVMSKIKLSVILKGIKPLIFVVIITAIINVFWYSPPEGTEPLFSFWKINIYLGGLLTALYMAVRILCLILGTGVVLTYTTSPIALTDAIESLLSPLKLIKLPVHEFSMMMTIALRFIPTLIEDTDILPFSCLEPIEWMIRADWQMKAGEVTAATNYQNKAAQWLKAQEITYDTVQTQVVINSIFEGSPGDISAESVNI